MAKNEFGVEINDDGGGFSLGAPIDIEDMLAEASKLSVEDDEISPRGDHSSGDPKQTSLPTTGGVSIDRSTETELGADTPGVTALASFENTENRNETKLEKVVDNFNDFGAESSDVGKQFNEHGNPVSFEGFDGPDQGLTEDIYDLGRDVQLEQTNAVPGSVPTEPVGEATSEPVRKPIKENSDYIERVILTSDAIRALSQENAKAVNIFITGGVPVSSHQELVLAALQADRQILKTTAATLEAKSKNSVDRAFYILGLDERTFVELGKMISNDLDTNETVNFEGDRLLYARRLVDSIQELTDTSIERFGAVRSVLQAGERVK